ncbi:MAG: chemotaxis protein CheA [Pseudomonadota bacterium]
MSDFAGMEDILQDFLLEASDLLAGVDNQLVDLEKRPGDKHLLNEIFRNFHTIKGGAGFLAANELVNLCHRTENLFDKLRNGQLAMNPFVLDAVLGATGVVKTMFDSLHRGKQPTAAPAHILDALDRILAGEVNGPAVTQAVTPAATTVNTAAVPIPAATDNWSTLYQHLTGQETTTASASSTPSLTPQRAAGSASELSAALELAPQTHVEMPSLSAVAMNTPSPTASPSPAIATPAGAMPGANASASSLSAQNSGPAPITVKENTIRVDTHRLDHVLNLSGEIGLTKNRLTTLRSEVLQGKTDAGTIRALDEAVSQLDLLVGDLQNAVMKTRMQPIGRLFQKYPRMARDLARQLGKDIELIISGEETEIDKTMIEDLNDPLVHLVRNAVDHGIESIADRLASKKPSKGIIRLDAYQVGDHIVIEVADDGRGMSADKLRTKAIEKGLIDLETANSLDDKQALQLIFLPGFSTKDQISSVSGRGVGMDVVKTNIQKLNGRLDIQSVPGGGGTTFSILLPLTLAIMPVLVVVVQSQPFAVPLAMVREIIPLRHEDVQEVSGRATMVVRDEVLPIRSLSHLLGWSHTQAPQFGVLMQSSSTNFILAIDDFIGRDDVVIKPLEAIKPKGIAGATLSGDGSVVLVLDMEEVLSHDGAESPSAMFHV